MKKTLLAITTANQLYYTKLCFDSLKKCDLRDVEVMIFDDASKDGTIEFCKKENIKIFEKDRPLGLTNSWNLAYSYFKEKGYQNLIIANNDVLIPPDSLNYLIDGLSEFSIVGPMSTRKGVFHQPLQSFDEYYQVDFDFTLPENYLKTQNVIEENKKGSGFIELPFVNGFFFAINRNVIHYEYSPTELFDPNNINIANEDELCNKVKEPKAVCIHSFIFHFKGVSFKDFTLPDGYLLERNLTWEDAERLNQNKFEFQYYRLKRKLKKLFTK
jgi:GT2 family glycosyltransferase